MKLHEGDKVKFLNSTGGGTVTRLLDSRMAMVADEDGFEMPTLISELVKADTEEAVAEDEPIVDYLPAESVEKRTSEEIFLAYVPHDQKWLVTGPVDVFLINNTSHDVIYNLFRRTARGHFRGIDYGSLFAGTRHLLATTDRDLITDWTEGSLQFLFHKERMEKVIPPFNSEFQIEVEKFSREESYRRSRLVDARGILVRIISLTGYIDEHRLIKDDTGPSPSRNQLFETEPSSPLIFRHQTGQRKAVVDLHIHELIDDPSNLQAGEILEFQKKYFINCLETALDNHFLNVIFIHGVGDGILRKELESHLKKTEGIEWFDAPMSTYGTGALEVRIPHNR